ncbi:MAG: hypothetical protein JJ863_10335 [Deltaproteobacteria bacterium]|nr:hypothetical protein [Deltaproteobacteria bacterium]
MPFVIRHQGFFYTDEFYAPGGVFKQIRGETFASREEAEATLKTRQRAWLRKATLQDYVFDERPVIEALAAYLREHFPDDHHDADGSYAWFFREHPRMLPEEATDKQIDALGAILGITFGQVFELAKGETATPEAPDPYDDLMYMD